MNTNAQTIETAKHTPGRDQVGTVEAGDYRPPADDSTRAESSRAPEHSTPDTRKFEPMSSANLTTMTLIAAAPDMLAALQSVDKRIEALIGEQRWYECGNEPANLCREVRAAIAKATGAAAVKGVVR